MLYDRAGLDESFEAYALIKPAKSFPICPLFFISYLFLVFLSRFPSYIEGNVKFKCGDGNYRLVSS
ncbi:hypothetical protein HanXRQr2_Chr11g0505831 [Helianthus annuus]|uniref:Uncharacterized protein n=1 Tax=Helianthus annuus TaxID=4232 RepID=A0A9K3HS24_HELAN|nr:hypothetical protein HanXRQr2_Chr11g0505831 [Helianthus annuus]